MCSSQRNSTFGCVLCVIPIFGFLVILGCSEEDQDNGVEPGHSDTDTDTDSDSDTGFATDTDADSDVDTDSGSDTGTLLQGCSGQILRKIPLDLGAPGPWPVGALTTTVGKMRTEIWYPATPGSESAADRVKYDIRDHLPDPSKVSEEENPIQTCDCYRDLPIDDQAGPYPAVLFLHGTAGFRTQNLEQMTHFASRGFIVVASDHPGICFKDMISNPLGTLGANQSRDARKIFDVLKNPVGDMTFLTSHVDTNRVGAMGHSAGGTAINGLGDIAKVLMPLAGAGNPGAYDSVLFMIGSEDTMGNHAAYDAAQAVRRRIVVDRGDHLTGTSLCGLRDPTDPSRTLLKIIQENNIGGVMGQMAGGLFKGCNELPEDESPFVSQITAIEIINYVTAGVLEETLQCSKTAAEQLSLVSVQFGNNVAEYQEELK